MTKFEQRGVQFQYEAQTKKLHRSRLSIAATAAAQKVFVLSATVVQSTARIR